MPSSRTSAAATTKFATNQPVQLRVATAFDELAWCVVRSSFLFPTPSAQQGGVPARLLAAGLGKVHHS
jgi:hypothetical protein